jgi:hypothetical protein
MPPPASLGGAYPDKAFDIVVGVSDSCTIRFHTDRPGQAWLAEDIEAYAEPVMSISVGNPQGR